MLLLFLFRLVAAATAVVVAVVSDVFCLFIAPTLHIVTVVVVVGAIAAAF